jgi:glycerol-3-phosphate dehydrogenase
MTMTRGKQNTHHAAHEDLNDNNQRKKICLLGSGNWGSAMASVIGENIQAHPSSFHPTLHMWVFEEVVHGRKLTDIINMDHENVKYLPGIKLPMNVVAVSDVNDALVGAHVLIFCIPHQFLETWLPHIKAAQDQGMLEPDCVAVSLIKGGLEFQETDEHLQLISDRISKALNHMDCSVLMGANLANEVARGDFSEATLGTLCAVEHMCVCAMQPPLASRVDVYRPEVLLCYDGSIHMVYRRRYQAWSHAFEDMVNSSDVAA